MQRLVQGGVFLVLVSLFLIGAQVFPRESSTLQTITPARIVEIGGQEVSVAVADTDALRQKGLSLYDYLENGEGMLFVFPEDGKYSFWMKDMRFSIDIMWFDASGAVVHIEKDVSPGTFPNSFTPSSPARYVVEVPAGWANLYNIQIGTHATFD